MSALVSISTKMAAAFNLGTDGAELLSVLKATAFKGQVSDAQMTALLIVAQQYGLNPWTKEIYAFPDRQNGIVPVVGVDGWARIINTHAQFDGMDFQQDEESCTCVIYRKDRSHPIKVTEWMAECKRANVGPWQSHPRRMLRHKAMIQCARLAFGFGGIYDEDEAQRIVEGEARDVTPRSQAAALAIAATIPEDSEERSELIKQLGEVASLGMTALRAEWNRIGGDARALVADKLEGFKAIAEKADTERAPGND